MTCEFKCMFIPGQKAETQRKKKLSGLRQDAFNCKVGSAARIRERQKRLKEQRDFHSKKGFYSFYCWADVRSHCRAVCMKEQWRLPWKMITSAPSGPFTPRSGSVTPVQPGTKWDCAELGGSGAFYLSAQTFPVWLQLHQGRVNAARPAGEMRAGATAPLGKSRGGSSWSGQAWWVWMDQGRVHQLRFHADTRARCV